MIEDEDISEALASREDNEAAFFALQQVELRNRVL
jgi:hypothetical protein